MIDGCGRKIEYLRVSVTDLCNLRCRYCMPEEGICKLSHDDMLTQEELITALKAAAFIGIKKVRFTGGEPLVKKNIIRICSEAGKIPGIEKICMTTNASFLYKMAGDLKAAGVSALNISLDTLSAEKYSYITRGGDIKEAFKGIEAALCGGFSKIKLNAVLIKGFNDDEIRPLAHLTLKYPVDVRFIELMPMPGSQFSNEAYISNSAVLSALGELQKAEDDGSVARLYTLPGALGNVGLISPLSCSFCAQCNRLRLTADGKIKPCLHSSREISVKSLSYEEMILKFKEAISEKPASHGLLDMENPSQAKRYMNQIGG